MVTPASVHNAAVGYESAVVASLQLLGPVVLRTYKHGNTEGVHSFILDSMLSVHAPLSLSTVALPRCASLPLCVPGVYPIGVVRHGAAVSTWQA